MFGMTDEYDWSPGELARVKVRAGSLRDGWSPPLHGGICLLLLNCGTRGSGDSRSVWEIMIDGQVRLVYEVELEDL